MTPALSDTALDGFSDELTKISGLMEDAVSSIRDPHVQKILAVGGGALLFAHLFNKSRHEYERGFQEGLPQEESFKYAGVGEWFRNQYNALGAAAGQASASQGTALDPFGRPDVPIMGTLKRYVGGQLPARTGPPGAISRMATRVAANPVVKKVAPIGQAIVEYGPGLAGLKAASLEKVAQVAPYQQKTQHTCSAACLVAVLGHYGFDADEHDVAGIIGVRQKGGAETTQIAVAARRMGLEAFEYSFDSLEQAALITEKDIPIIADIQSFKHPGSGHYVVITKIDEQGVHIMDPNVDGNVRLVSHEEMDGRWWDRAMQPPHKPMVRWGVIVLPPERS